MVDPLSATAIGAVVLAEAIKFLYGQAGELLKRRRERAEEAATGQPATTDPAPSGQPETTDPAPSGQPAVAEPVLTPPGGLIEGQLAACSPDNERLERLADQILAARRELADYVDGVARVDPADPVLLERVDALRGLLEVVYGQRITFAGESRDPSGPLVVGEVAVAEVSGVATAVRAATATGGRVIGKITAQRVTGSVIGVDVDQLG